MRAAARIVRRIPRMEMAERLVIDRGDKYVGSPGEFGFVEDGDGRFSGSGAVCLDDHRHRFLLDQSGDDGSDSGDTDVSSTVKNLSSAGHCEEDAILLQILLRGSSGFVDLDSSFFDEDGRDDEKDEQNENDIN